MNGFWRKGHGQAVEFFSFIIFSCSGLILDIDNCFLLSKILVCDLVPECVIDIWFLHMYL